MADFNGNYILSNLIAVYPSAYRSPQYDFAARLNLEESFITLSKQTNKNYIYSWDDATANTSALLVVFVGGYLFKIKVAKNSITDDNRYLCIKTKEVGTTDTKKTKVLINFDTNSLILDEQPSGVIDYYFKGAAFRNTSTDSTAYIDLKDPASYYIVNHDVVLNKKATTPVPVISQLIDAGGDGTISSLYKNNNSWIPNTVNSSTNSVVLGAHNTLGDSPSSEIHDNFIFGQWNESTQDKTVLLGAYLKSTTSENKTVIGKYNADTSGNIFEIGYGTSNDNRKNIFTVDTSGNAAATGTLTVGVDEISGNALTIQHGDFNVADGNARIENGLYIKGTNGTGGLVVDQNSILSGPVSCGSTLEVTGTTTSGQKLTVSTQGADITDNLVVRSSSTNNSKISLYGTGTGNEVTYKTTFEYDTGTQCLKIKVS